MIVREATYLIIKHICSIDFHYYHSVTPKCVFTCTLQTPDI